MVIFIIFILLIMCLLKYKKLNIAAFFFVRCFNFEGKKYRTLFGGGIYAKEDHIQFRKV